VWFAKNAPDSGVGSRSHQGSLKWDVSRDKDTVISSPVWRLTEEQPRIRGEREDH
jgi:hypothetical protein